MAEKILNTRIQLKYDTWANWTDETQANKGANLVLKKGEIAFCEIPTGNAEATTAPTVLFKVGDGTSTFKALKWASALAADVHEWAKAATKPGYSANEITVTDANGNFNGTNVEAVLAEIAGELATLTGGESGSGTIANRIDTAIKAIQGDTATAGNYVTGVSINADGNLEVSEAALPASATPEQGNKADSAIQTLNILGKALNKDTNTLSIDEGKEALGLKSAAYTESTAYATDVQGQKADSAIQGIKVNNAELSKDGDNKIDITESIKAVAAAEINTLIGGANKEDTIQDINTLITYVNENGADTTAILTELYGTDTETSRIDKLEAKAGLEKVGTVVKVSAGTGLSGADITESGTIALDDAYVKTIKVNEAGKADSATNADDSAKLGGVEASEYLLADNAPGYDDIFTKTAAKTTIDQASTALQTISAGTGLKVEEKANNNQEIGFDPDCVFIFNCGTATEII